MSDKKKTNKLIDNLVYDLTDIYKLYAERTEDPVIVAGVFFAVAMAKMRRELDDKEFEIFIEQFDDVKEIIMEEEITSEEMKEISNRIMRDLSTDQIFLIAKIFKENHRVEITTMLLN